MSSSKPADSSSTAIVVAVALLALLLLLGGGAAFFLLRRARVMREVAVEARMQAVQAEQEAIARMRAPVPAQPEPGVEDDAELKSALGRVLQERFFRRTGEPERAPEGMAEIAAALSLAIAGRARPPATERELRRECAWAWEQAGRPVEAERELLRALELLGQEPGEQRAAIETDLERLRGRSPR